MKKQKYASNESIRSLVLDNYNITPDSPDPDYDQLVFLSAIFLNVPVAYLSIIEPETICFKASYGTNIEKVKRENSFTQALLDAGKDFFSVNYSTNNQLFDDAGARYGSEFKFYAAVLLKDPQGYPLGALNILDTTERELDDLQEKALKALANQSMKLLEYGKQKHQFLRIQNMLKRKYVELEKFTSLVSHDIKSPLANIISLTELLKAENAGKFDEDTNQYLDYLVESSYSLRNYVDGILSFYRSERMLEKDSENVDLHQILEGIGKLYDVTEDVIIEYPKSAILHHVNKAALTQVFLNLISNALKYNRKPIRKVKIKYREQEKFYRFDVIDNGEGFAEEDASRIFNLFTTLDTTDREGNPGSGIGLATVKKLVTSMGGTIWVKSVLGEGSTFSFTIKRV